MTNAFQGGNKIHNILENILTSKKRPMAIEGAFYAKTKPCYILGDNELKEA
jgi:hypothetical protein